VPGGTALSAPGQSKRAARKTDLLGRLNQKHLRIVIERPAECTSPSEFTEKRDRPASRKPKKESMQYRLEKSPRDSELLEGARNGDQDAFGELLRRHYQRCVNLASSILRDRGEAEEEAQNACWKAYEHLNQFQGDSEFSSWLLQIVKNQCLMLIRRRHGMQFLHLDERGPEDGNEIIQLPSAAMDPEGAFGSREVQQALRREIRRIPRVLRNVIMLRDVQQLPMPELAAQLGISVAAAKSRLLRARIELRNRMARHCGKTGAWILMSGPAAPPAKVFHRYAHP
jgi:RNA polymerase sigma-70 factor (ECF subfamily)